MQYRLSLVGDPDYIALTPVDDFANNHNVTPIELLKDRNRPPGCEESKEILDPWINP